MGVILYVMKMGGSLFIRLPKALCKEVNFKKGDYLLIEKDVLTETFNLKKVGHDNGSVEKQKS